MSFTEVKTMNLSLKSIESTLRKNAPTLGKAYGYLGPMANQAQAQGRDIISDIIMQHEQALAAITQGKLPDPKHVLDVLRHEDWARPVLKNALIAYLAGELGGGIIGGSNAAALKKFGINTAKYTILSAAVCVMGWNPSHLEDDAEQEAKFFERNVASANKPMMNYALANY